VQPVRCGAGGGGGAGGYHGGLVLPLHYLPGLRVWERVNGSVGEN
jgi:hypothetical protein